MNYEDNKEFQPTKSSAVTSIIRIFDMIFLFFFHFRALWVFSLTRTLTQLCQRKASDQTKILFSSSHVMYDTYIAASFNLCREHVAPLQTAEHQHSSPVTKNGRQHGGIDCANTPRPINSSSINSLAKAKKKKRSNLCERLPVSFLLRVHPR